MTSRKQSVCFKEYEKMTPAHWDVLKAIAEEDNELSGDAIRAKFPAGARQRLVNLSVLEGWEFVVRRLDHERGVCVWSVTNLGWRLGNAWTGIVQ